MKLSSVSLSDGFIIDSSPPIMGEISLTNPFVIRDNEKQYFTHSRILVKWEKFSDIESDIKKYFICVGTAPGRCNTMPFVSVGNATRYNTTSLDLEHKTLYYISVKAANGAGLQSETASSSGLFVDKTGETIFCYSCLC